jgi:tRNA threonylcarbamoyladenosine biosynthesis protein TsaE
MARTAETLTLEQLEARAADLWAELPRGAAVWLTGDLGAGKTTFVKALVRAAAGEEARSPTYALVHEYDSPGGTLAHVDCYRLVDPEEARDLDFPDLHDRCRLLLIEWPERGGEHVPPPDAHLHFAHDRGDDVRRVERVV